MARLVAFARARPLFLLALMLVGALLPRLPTLAQPLLEKHGFRQTWTAWTAVIYHESGIDLLHPRVPIFGPPFELPSEFPLFQALGAIVMTTGIAADPAMRIAGLLCFALTAVFLWLLLRDVAGEAVAFVAVAVFLATPLGLVWSRTSMIEYLATAGALAYCWAGLRWRNGRGLVWFAIALATGIAAAAVKPPTLVFWALPLFFDRTVSEAPGVSGWLRARLDPRAIALAIAPVSVAYAWLAYGDATKQRDVAMRFLSSAGPLWRDYYYGTLADRMSVTQWGRIGDVFVRLAIGWGLIALAPFAAVAATRASHRGFWIGLALSIAVPVLVFFGAFHKHDYYFIALTPQLAAFAGLGAVWLVNRVPLPAWRPALGVALAAAAVVSLVTSRDYWEPIYRPVHDAESILPRAREIAAASGAGDLVLSVGRGYDPDVLYYARRNALMLTLENLTQRLVDEIPIARYRTLVTWDPWRDELWVARHWRWVGARSQRVYALGSTLAELRSTPLAATDDTGPYETARRFARELLSRPLVIPCDISGADVPVGPRGTLLRLRSDYPIGARLGAGVLVGPVPARAVIVVGPELTFGASVLRVTCGGAGSLTVESALEVDTLSLQ